jgi:NAD(P)-dependent dehydrogenase (short-subunit alcohol dehydrogenase family)
MEPFCSKRCFVTGAASDIGRATALKLAAQGTELYLTDRNAEGPETTFADASALAATVVGHRALDISDNAQVLGYALRFPGTADSIEFWANFPTLQNVEEDSTLGFGYPV